MFTLVGIRPRLDGAVDTADEGLLQYVDPHDYNRSDLERYHSVAKARMQTLEGFETPGDVEDYPDENNAFNAADIQERIDRA